MPGKPNNYPVVTGLKKYTSNKFELIRKYKMLVFQKRKNKHTNYSSNYSTCIIVYEIISESCDINKLSDNIKKLGIWWKCIDSVWIVKSELRAAGIRDILIDNLADTDKLLVIELASEAAWTQSFPYPCKDWLKVHLGARSTVSL